MCQPLVLSQVPVHELTENQSIWWDDEQSGDGIVHLVQDDGTLPPTTAYPGHSTYCGSVKFPEPGELGDRAVRQSTESFDDVYSYHELEPVSEPQTIYSSEHDLCEECRRVYVDSLKRADERTGVALFHGQSTGIGGERTACIARTFVHDCGKAGVEYEVAELLCSGIRLGTPRWCQSFDSVRLVDPESVFEGVMCPECLDRYEAAAWQPVIERSQIEVTVLTEGDLEALNPIEERHVRSRLEKASNPLQGSGWQAITDDTLLQRLPTNVYAATNLEFGNLSTVVLTNHLGHTRGIDAHYVLQIGLSPGRLVLY